MSRTRLTTRTAADMKAKPGAQVEDKGTGIDNDTAAVNNPEHTKNDPSVSEYAKGDPSAWAEDVNTNNPAKDDKKREDTGHAPLIDKHAAQEAIASARKLEEKAVKAIIASQRMLPGATDEIIEKQAGILMHLPEEGLNATLANQEGLAKMIAKAATDSSEKHEESETPAEEKKEEECKDKDASDDKDEDDKEPKEAAKNQNDPHAFGTKQEKLAALKKQAEALEQEIAKEAAPVEEKEEEKKEVEAAAPVEEKEKEEEKEVEASDASLLDQIFSGVMPAPIKKGASKLSGMVKKEASAGANDNLSGLWSSAPDVSGIFS